MQNHSNDFYTGYEDNEQTFLPDNAEPQITTDIIDVHAKKVTKQKKKDILATVFLTPALSMGVYILEKFLLMLPTLSIIDFCIKLILQHVPILVALVGGLFFADKIVRHVSSIGGQDNEDIRNPHIICLTIGSCLSLFLATFQSNLWIPVILFLVCCGFIAVSFKFYTAFEKKCFVPIMSVTALLAIILHIPAIAYELTPRTDLVFSADYCFVSAEHIEPKNQDAQYYTDSDLREVLGEVAVGGGVIESYRQFKDDIIYYDDSHVGHYVFFDTPIAKRMKMLSEKFDTVYDEAFFENNYLLIEMIQYPESAEKAVVSNITLHGNSLEITEDISYPRTVGDDLNFTELCIAFIKIPKRYRLSNSMNTSYERNIMES